MKKVDQIYHPCNVIQWKLGAPKDYLKACINKLYEIGDECNNETNVQAPMTNYYMWEDYPLFHLLLKKIYEKIINEPLNNFLFGEMHTNYLTPRITNAWGAIYSKDHFTFPHIHLPSLYSFVYYIQVDNTTPPLVFDGANYHINPGEDTLIGFPAYVEHSVPKSKSDKDRIVIAGNIDMIRKSHLTKDEINTCWAPS